MTKKLKKSLATLLAASMILSLASVSAFAADEPDVAPAGDTTPVVEQPVDPIEPAPAPITEVEPAPVIEDEPALASEPAPLADPVEEPAGPSTQEEWKAWVGEQLGDNKFIAVLASKLADGTVDAVMGTVDSGYNAKLVLPSSANSGSAVIGVGMKDVASLGVDGVKTHAMILRNGEGGDVTTLSDLVPNLYGFGGATVNATIVGADKAEHPVTYTISAARDNVITATPTGAVADAWHAMVNDTNFATGENVGENSFVVIANGSWLQIGDQVLQFEQDASGNLVLDNITNFSELNETIRSAVELVNAENAPVCFYLAAGTKLAVSSSYAELLEPVTVTTDVALDGSILTDLRDNSVSGFTALLGLMDDVLTQVSGQEVNVTIKFGEPEAAQDDWKTWVESQLGENGKFAAVLASKLADGTIDAVVGTVDNDYNAKLVLPNSANSGSAVIGVAMKNVGSLGVDGVRSHAMVLREGEGNDVAVNGMVESLYGFSGATVNATIIDIDKEEHPVTYTISAAGVVDGKTTITAAAGEGVSEAWHAMVNDTNFATGTQSADSKVVIANGSWLQIGDKVLQFEQDETGNLVLDNITDFSALNETIRNAVELVNKDSAPVCFHLEAGTKLAVSSSYAELLQPVTVTTDVALNGQILEDLRDNGVSGFTALLGLMDDVLTAVDGKTVNVTIEFGCVHAYGDPTWTWSGYTSATATFTCTECDDEQTVDAAITSATSGNTITYTATVTGPDGETYTDTRTQTISTGGDTGGGTTTPTTPSGEEENVDENDTPLSEKPFLFEDVKEDDWFYEDVKTVFELGLMEGSSDTHFEPYGDTTRGSVAVILYRLVGQPEVEGEALPDVAESAFYHKASIWAVQNGVYTGYDNGNFGGDDLVTREQLVTVLYRFVKMKTLDASQTTELSAYVDAHEVGSWADEAMRWAVAIGLVEGRSANALVPQADTVRIELATILNRFVEKYPSIVPVAEPAEK